MSELLALHLENSTVCGLDAQVGKGSVRLRSGFQLRVPEHLASSGTPGEIGEWLKEELRRAGAGAKHAAVTIPREECIVRRLDLPNAPDDELPEMVRMQAATVSAAPMERTLLDFLPLPQAEGAQGRSVLMVTVPRERALQVRRMVEAAGLELVSLGVEPMTTAELVARAEQRSGDDPHEVSLVLAPFENRVDVSLLRDRSLIFTHSTDLVGESEAERAQSILPEISRVLVTLQNQFGESRISRGWIIGTRDENEALRDAVASRFGARLDFLDPLADPAIKQSGSSAPGIRGGYAAPAGTLLHAAGQTVPAVDLLNPRKPPEKKDHTRLRAAALAAAAVLLAVIGSGVLWMQRSDLDKKIADREQQKLDLQDFVKKGEPVLQSAGLVEEWTDQQVDWLTQLNELQKLLPGTGDIYLTDFRVMPPVRSDAIARIQATGYAREHAQVDALYKRLDAGPYRPQPYTYNPGGKSDPKYPFPFQIDMELLAQPEPAESPQPTEPPAKT